jgi:hypothetical protein
MRTALIGLAALAVAAPARAQQLPLKGYGQELVDQVMAKERGLLVVVMHVSPPGTANYPIIASNIGRIGKVADDDDMRVVTTGKTNLEVAHGGARFEVEMPMRDLAGNTIGALGIVFPYRDGVSKAALEKRAVSIRDWLARRILDAGSLVEPYPFDPLATTRTYAQKLVEATLARHAEIDLLAVSARPPKGRDYVIVASSFGRVGMKAEELTPDRPRAGARSGGKRYEVELPLLDEKGGAAGALTVGWPVREGDDQKVFLSKAEQIRDELRGRIPALEKLVELDP